MKKLNFFGLTALLMLCAAAPGNTVPAFPARQEALMDFDFTGSGGKTKLSDRTGNYTLYSDTAPMLEEYGALRVADGAKLRIPCKDGAFGEKVTIEMWFMTSGSSGKYFMPLLERGIQYGTAVHVQPYELDKNKFDFSMYFCADKLPGFVTGNAAGDKAGTEGLVAYGNAYIKSCFYYNKHISYNPAELFTDPAKIFRYNQWMHYVVVYDHGSVTAYLNGVKVARSTQSRTKLLLTSGLDIYIGIFNTGEALNKQTGEFLIKSLCITPKAMTAQDISRRWEKEKQHIRQEKRFDRNLQMTRHYWTLEQKASDPGMTRELKMVTAFKKNLPKDPFLGKKEMTAKMGENASILINGKKLPPLLVRSGSGDRDLRRRKIITLDFAAAGFESISFDIRNCWVAEEKYDWTELDRFLKLYVENCPANKIAPQINLTPPEWFKKKYPQELEQQVISKPGEPEVLSTWKGHGSLHGSDLYMNLAYKMIRALVKHCETSPYANHIWGYHLAGGDANEWYWPGQFTPGYTGYSAPTQKLFRDYIRKKYKNDLSLLRKAWQNPAITFETVRVPSIERRLTSENLIFRDPARSQDVTDIRLFMQERTLHCAIESAKAVKEAAGKDKIVFTYYGYPLLYAGSTLMPFSGLQTTTEIFKSPYIDMLATPIDYSLRRCGEPGVNINGFTGTARLYNKLIFREEDSPTHLATTNLNSRTPTLRETNEIKRRSLGYTLTGPYGFWYCWMMGFHGFHQEEIMEDAAKLLEISKASLNLPQNSVAEAAVILDEKDSITYLAPERMNKFLTDTTWGVFRSLHQAGAPFETYMLSDLENPRMPDYKIYFFLNAWSITPQQRQMIHRKLTRNNALAVWLYAPGYLNGKTFSLQNMEKLTGIRFKDLRKTMTLGSDVDKVGNPALLKRFVEFPAHTFGPVFHADETSAGILLKSRDLNIMAYKQMPGWRSFWTLLPPDLAIIRNLYDHANVHIYSRRGDTLTVNGSYLMLHAAKPGKVTIKLPRKQHVKECFTRKDLGKTDTITDEIPQKGTTRIWQLK